MRGVGDRYAGSAGPTIVSAVLLWGLFGLCGLGAAAGWAGCDTKKPPVDYGERLGEVRARLGSYDQQGKTLELAGDLARLAERATGVAAAEAHFLAGRLFFDLLTYAMEVEDEELFEEVANRLGVRGCPRVPRPVDLACRAALANVINERFIAAGRAERGEGGGSGERGGSGGSGGRGGSGGSGGRGGTGGRGGGGERGGFGGSGRRDGAGVDEEIERCCRTGGSASCGGAFAEDACYMSWLVRLYLIHRPFGGPAYLEGVGRLAGLRNPAGTRARLLVALDSLQALEENGPQTWIDHPWRLAKIGSYGCPPLAEGRSRPILFWEAALREAGCSFLCEGAKGFSFEAAKVCSKSEINAFGLESKKVDPYTKEGFVVARALGFLVQCAKGLRAERRDPMLSLFSAAIGRWLRAVERIGETFGSSKPADRGRHP